MSRCKHEHVTVRMMVVVHGRKAECQDCHASWGSWRRNPPKWAVRAFAADNARRQPFVETFKTLDEFGQPPSKTTE